MADWPTIASLATAGGTLVLAVATFSSVRSAQRTTRLAERSTQLSERALLIGLRPVLVPSRESDPVESVRFVEGRTVDVEGGMAGIEHEGESFYFVMPLRNVGPGLGVIHGWYVTPSEPQAMGNHAEPEEFRPRPSISTCRPATPAFGRGRSASPTTRCGPAWPSLSPPARR